MLEHLTYLFMKLGITFLALGAAGLFILVWCARRAP